VFLSHSVGVDLGEPLPDRWSPLSPEGLDPPGYPAPDPVGQQHLGQSPPAHAGLEYSDGISETTATRVTADLRKVREALGDLG
jgi:hypothetical protein